MQRMIRVKVKAADGALVAFDVCNTINRVQRRSPPDSISLPFCGHGS
jgi:hypothetical protein